MFLKLNLKPTSCTLAARGAHSRQKCPLEPSRAVTSRPQLSPLPFPLRHDEQNFRPQFNGCQRARLYLSSVLIPKLPPNLHPRGARAKLAAAFAKERGQKLPTARSHVGATDY
eukprot:7121313-Pyramimonas_sp.AAC.1